MFAPHTAHLPRTLSSMHGAGGGGATTGRRRLQVHDENDKMPTKTPSRMGQAGAGGTGKAALLNTARLGLGARTEGKDKNVLGLGGGKTPGPSKDNQGQGGKGAGGGKGKEKDAEDIAPKRLFANPKLAPSTSFSSLQPIVHPKTHARSGSTFTGLPSALNASHSHKTPARAPPTARKAGAGAASNLNIRTPAPSAFRIARDASPAAPAPVLSTPLASAQRDRRRRSTTGRSSLSLSLSHSGAHRLSHPGSGGKEKKEMVYKTPLPNRHWANGGDDGQGEGEGDSMDDIQLAPDLQQQQQQVLNEGEVGLDVLREDEEEESDGEIEYMPPKLHIPFQPSYECPRFDPAELYGPDSDPEDCERGPKTPELVLLDVADVPMIPDEELEDPIFRHIHLTPPAPVAAPSIQKSVKPGIASGKGTRPGLTKVPARLATTTAQRAPASTAAPAPVRSAIKTGPKPLARSGANTGSAHTTVAANAKANAPGGSAAAVRKTGGVRFGPTSTLAPAPAPAAARANVRSTKPALPAAAFARRHATTSRLPMQSVTGVGASSSARARARATASARGGPALKQEKQEQGPERDEALLALEEEVQSGLDALGMDVLFFETVTEMNEEEGEGGVGEDGTEGGRVGERV